MTTQTALIIQAAKGYRQWGRLPARQFAMKRGLDLRLVRLARQLEAAASPQWPQGWTLRSMR